MSRQKGLIKLEGNMGGISFYSSEGKHLARLANGPSKERILNDPAFERTRENNREFGGCAKVSKAVRSSLSAVLGSMAGSRLTARLTGLFKTVNLKTAGKRGKRGIELSKNKTSLKNFDLDKKINLSAVFSAPIEATNNVDRNESTITVPSFVPADFINAPSGATHFRLVAAIGAVSDYVLNSGSNQYEATNPELDGIGAVTFGAYNPIDTTAVDFVLTTAFAGAPVVDGKVSVLQCIGIEFYQEVSGEYYALAQDNAMKVINVF